MLGIFPKVEHAGPAHRHRWQSTWVGTWGWVPSMNSCFKSTEGTNSKNHRIFQNHHLLQQSLCTVTLGFLLTYAFVTLAFEIPTTFDGTKKEKTMLNIILWFKIIFSIKIAIYVAIPFLDRTNPSRNLTHCDSGEASWAICRVQGATINHTN